MAEARTNEDTDNRVNEETDNRVNEETDKRGNEDAPKAEGADVKAEDSGKKKLNRDTAENRKKGDKKEASKMLPFYTKASSGLRMGHMYLNNPLPIAKIAHWKEMCKKKGRIIRLDFKHIEKVMMSRWHEKSRNVVAAFYGWKLIYFLSLAGAFFLSFS